MKNFILPLLLSALFPLYGQVTHERLLNADSEPGNWLTYSGNYRGWRYSRLDQITPENVKNLRLKWVHQMYNAQIETTPLVVDGVMYLTDNGGPATSSTSNPSGTESSGRAGPVSRVNGVNMMNGRVPPTSRPPATISPVFSSL